MSFRLFGCSKYRRLANERFDRALSLSEREFLNKHKSVCPDCRRTEMQSATALNMLRLAAFEPDASNTESDDIFGAHFEERVIRRLRVQSTKESVRYWSPAFVGAVIAGLTVLAALQLVSDRPGVPSMTNPEGTAYAKPSSTQLPTFDLSKIERIR